MTINELIENFELLGDWEERYAYLIDLGKKLPGRADSDAFIVRGLIGVLMILFDGKTPAEIIQADGKSIFSKLGLDQHLSPTRKNGLFAMVERIRSLALANSGVNVTVAKTS